MNAPNTTDSEDSAEIERAVRQVGERAKAASALLARSTAEQRSRALVAAAAAIRAASPRLVEANQEDMAAAEKQSLTAALLDRLRLDAGRVEAMAAGVAAVASLPDPVGRTLSEITRPNGLRIARVSVPLGVIGIIYESRPNVTADAGGLALKSGNAAILRGGSESFRSSRALVAALRDGLRAAGLPEDSIQLVPTRDRDAVGMML